MRYFNIYMILAGLAVGGLTLGFFNLNKRLKEHRYLHKIESDKKSFTDCVMVAKNEADLNKCLLKKGKNDR